MDSTRTPARKTSVRSGAADNGVVPMDTEALAAPAESTDGLGISSLSAGRQLLQSAVMMLSGALLPTLKLITAPDHAIVVSPTADSGIDVSQTGSKKLKTSSSGSSKSTPAKQGRSGGVGSDRVVSSIQSLADHPCWLLLVPQLPSHLRALEAVMTSESGLSVDSLLSVSAIEVCTRLQLVRSALLSLHVSHARSAHPLLQTLLGHSESATKGQDASAPLSLVSQLAKDMVVSYQQIGARCVVDSALLAPASSFAVLNITHDEVARSYLLYLLRQNVTLLIRSASAESFAALLTSCMRSLTTAGSDQAHADQSLVKRRAGWLRVLGSSQLLHTIIEESRGKPRQHALNQHVSTVFPAFSSLAMALAQTPLHARAKASQIRYTVALVGNVLQSMTAVLSAVMTRANTLPLDTTHIADVMATMVGLHSTLVRVRRLHIQLQQPRSASLIGAEYSTADGAVFEQTQAALAHCITGAVSVLTDCLKFRSHLCYNSIAPFLQHARQLLSLSLECSAGVNADVAGPAAPRSAADAMSGRSPFPVVVAEAVARLFEEMGKTVCNAVVAVNNCIMSDIAMFVVSTPRRITRPSANTCPTCCSISFSSTPVTRYQLATEPYCCLVCMRSSARAPSTNCSCSTRPWILEAGACSSICT